ncbi:hypothetical protein B0A50_06969 [Salinomyces thailandicus]|uniref:Uncharacterized protein n=1 Tax=Salinomyces thailandicus TaxID=706561 RepID=A0A4U0TP78_9PEZI|nr:hypothetical protein B0A50_06969 [Salinomyces thailandica]
MSQDLFAAFGSPTEKPTASNNDTFTAPSSQFSSQPQQFAAVQKPDTESDDDFGDFEDASANVAVPSAASGWRTQGIKTATSPYQPEKSKPDPKAKEQPKSPGRHPFAGAMDVLFAADDDDDYNAGADDLGDLSTNPEAAVAYSKRVIANQQEQQPKRTLPPAAAKPPAKAEAVAQKPEPRSPNKLRKKSGYVPAKDPNVLFDAENLSEQDGEDTDEFGDFEETEPTQRSNMQGTGRHRSDDAATSSHPAIDLLGLDDSPAPLPAFQPNKQSRPDPKASVRPPVTTSEVAKVEDDAWDDFEETSTSTPRPSLPPNAPKPTNQPATPYPPATPPKPSNPSLLPPTNIPPPAILLSIIPTILAAAEQALFTPLSRLDPKQKHNLLSHPATHAFLTNHLTTSQALAHIIAGRKQRWKRDQFLAQSMRIGPAAAGPGGRKTGMKLTGVDKSEAAKEEREVLEAVRLWRSQAGKLRSAVSGAAAGAGPQGKKLGTVPEIAEVMHVRALKAGEGGLIAAQACGLCGLKREERVVKVDEVVEDSFGEWWVQGVGMHLVCLRFWEEYKGRLRSR